MIAPSPKIRTHNPIWVVGALVLLGLAWRIVRYTLGFPIWGDEAFIAINLVVRDFRGLFEPLIYAQIAPLGFMWIELAASRVLGLSEWALRLVPLLAGLAALLLLWRFARRALPRDAALLATGIFAVSYYPVRHAIEVKPYGLDLLVALGLITLAWTVLQPRPQARGGRRWAWAGLILLAALGPWLSYPSLFVLAMIIIVLAWEALRGRTMPSRTALPEPSSRRAPFGLTAVLAVAAVFGLSAGAMYFTYARPHAAVAAPLLVQEWQRAFPPFDQPWKVPLWLVLVHTGNMLAYPVGGQNGGSTVTLVLVIVGAVWLARRRPQLLALLLGPLVPALAAAVIRAYPYGDSARTMLYMAPALCLVAGTGAAAIIRRLVPPGRRTFVRHIAAGVLGLIGTIGLARDIRQPFKSEAVYRGRQIVRDLAARAGPEDRWIVFNAATPVEHAPYLGDWRGIGGQFVFDVLRYAPVPLDWSPPPEAAARLAPAGNVWLLVYRAEHERKGVRFSQAQLDRYVDVLAARFGTPQQESHEVKRESANGKDERVVVYRFGPG